MKQFFIKITSIYDRPEEYDNKFKEPYVQGPFSEENVKAAFIDTIEFEKEVNVYKVIKETETYFEGRGDDGFCGFTLKVEIEEVEE